MTVVRAGTARRHTTPNAEMTTLASPALAGSELALWWVEMKGGQAGPEHSLDTEQLLTIVEGSGSVQEPRCVRDSRVSVPGKESGGAATGRSNGAF